MNKARYILILLAVAAFVVVSNSSCRKSAYPRESYRGAGYRYDPTLYKSNRVKAKKYRPYKAVRVKPSNYNR